jgi:hypothetical protein
VRPPGTVCAPFDVSVSVAGHPPEAWLGFDGQSPWGVRDYLSAVISSVGLAWPAHRFGHPGRLGVTIPMATKNSRCDLRLAERRAPTTTCRIGRMPTYAQRERRRAAGDQDPTGRLLSANAIARFDVGRAGHSNRPAVNLGTLFSAKALRSPAARSARTCATTAAFPASLTVPSPTH